MMFAAWFILAMVVIILMVVCAYVIFRIFRRQDGFDTCYLSVAAVFLIVFEVLLALTLFISIVMCFR